VDRYSFDVGRSHPFPRAGLSRRFPPVPCRSRRPGSRRLHAGHHLARQRAPARLIPGSVRHPGFDVTCICFDTSTANRLRSPSRSPPDTSHAPFPHRSPRSRRRSRSMWRFEASPAGRLRRADNPSSPAQHRFTKLYLHRTPFHRRDTPTSRCRSSSGLCTDTHTPKPPNKPTLSVPPPRVRRGSSPKIHADRDTLIALGGCQVRGGLVGDVVSVGA
jgi:hypothetical protein